MIRDAVKGTQHVLGLVRFQWDGTALGALKGRFSSGSQGSLPIR